jgi:hypothetical protein
MDELITIFMNNDDISTYEEEIMSGKKINNGIYKKLYNTDIIGDDLNVDSFFKSIANCLNMSVSSRIGFVVTKSANEEVSEDLSREKQFTLIVGYMPNTTVKIIQNDDDMLEIQFNKGDLIILNHSLKYTFGNPKYTANKVFEVLYLFDKKKKIV